MNLVAVKFPALDCAVLLVFIYSLLSTEPSAFKNWEEVPLVFLNEVA